MPEENGGVDVGEGDVRVDFPTIVYKIVSSYSKTECMNGSLSWKDRITANPAQCGGRPCIRGMRIRVIDVLDLLASGLTQVQVLEELPDLEKEDIEAVLRYASSRFDHPVIAA